ncbi:very low-density lipoprotein receptor-like isoform X2 [Haliotis rufescens]|uniref:very low-density lipoprotein receptor-like isoform X2 n=1 Tax=Haliotis rufescens TaxID=6454 RepID=UPI001EB0A924|nr:very low-density lipoprotein receptor-like isoform X2 [Haliotis rufescens]
MKIFSRRIDKLVLVPAILIVFLIVLQGVTGEYPPTNSSCPSTQFQCNDAKCIPMGWRCDGDVDCTDKSDEIDCPSTTCAEDEFHCQDKKCIPMRWTCDKDNDCKDGSDEATELCNRRTCGPDKFVCDSGVCIPSDWRCDGSSDCQGGEDEKNCTSTCEGDEYRCDNGQCIAQRWKCDGDKDCKDGSDEDKCESPQSCEPDEFMCHDGPCIKKDWQCDGDFDCNDRSDENKCNGTTTECSESQFKCKTSGECIHSSWFCDNDDDCEDLSDENCNTTCRSDQIMCLEGRYCLSKSVQCDGSKDCQDGSDEVNCTTPSPCKETDFHCGDGVCIDKSLVCDGTMNCKNMEDENKDQGCAHDPCSDNNGGCDHICVNLFGNKRKCDCNPGFTLMNDSETVCTDIDECKDNLIHGTCSQICKNTKGGYKCECVNNYSLVNKRYCKADGGHPELLLASRKDLRKITLETFDYNLLLDDGHISAAIAMDFDFVGKKFYWTDVAKEAVFRADFGNKSSVEEVASTDVSTPDGLAVDWINKHLYWTDTGFDRIEVSSLDGKMRKTLINTGLDEPRAIVLDPNHGLMYWTDWGKQPKIERCGMDGNDRKVIINTTITWPNGLTIDYVANRLYWIDAKRHTIESSNMLGLERVSILKSHLHLNHPFAITVFEDYLYWTDWPSESVRKFSKFGRRGEEISQVETIALNLHSPMDVHVFHPYRQQIQRRLCGTDNGGCSHFCLPKAYDARNTEFYVCDCPNGFVLSSDRKNCVEGDVTTGTTPSKASPTPVPVEPDSPNRSHNRSSSHGPAVVTTGKTPVSEVTAVPATGSEVTEGPGYTVVSHPDQVNTTEQHTPEHMAEENIGHIAGIVISVLCALFLILGIVGYVLYKRYSRGHGKSMNFDNPVYRKTTTADDVTIENKLPPSMQPLTQNNGDVIC